MSQHSKQNKLCKQFNKYEVKIKQDQQDLANLSLQIVKVQKLKKQHTLQKQEINQLKQVIQQLKSQNDELKSKSLRKEKFDKQTRMQNQQETLLSNSDHQDKLNQTGRAKIQKNKEKQNKSQEKNTTKPRQKIFKPAKQQNIIRQKNKKNKFGPQSNLNFRNCSGFISSAHKLLSPQARTNVTSQTYRLLNQLNSPPFTSDEDESSHFDSTHFKTKTKLVDDLFSDIQFQLQQVSSSLKAQKISHQATKKLLKKTINQNQAFSEVNEKLSPLFLTNQLLQKQNEYLKKQLYKLTQIKTTLQATNNQNNTEKQLYNQMVKLNWQEQQNEFRIMDRIYEDFLDICEKMDRKKQKNKRQYKSLLRRQMQLI